MKRDIHRSVGFGLVAAGLLCNRLTLPLVGVDFPNRRTAWLMVVLPLAAIALGLYILQTKPRLTISYLLYLVVLLTIFGYGGRVVIRSWSFYQFATNDHRRGWRGRATIPDPQLGLKARPNARAAEIFPVGSDIPMRFDHWGFRVPVDSPERALPLPKPVWLFLGCSFTYGAACTAEDTYPFQLERLSGGTALNAAACSYGLAQMMQQAETLIPEFKPDYVIVQYSPWLVNRAVSGFAPTYYGRCPTPYFYDAAGSVKLHPPLFDWKTVTLPVERYLGQKPTAAGFVNFLFAVGLSQAWHDDWNMLGVGVGQFFGVIPHKTNNRMAVVNIVYNHIADIARRQGVGMVVVRLTGGAKDGGDAEWAEISKLPDAMMVDAEATLLDSLKHLGDDYAHAYKHWRGEPPTLVDSHPNPRAHRIIAGAIWQAVSLWASDHK
jgi:hypothetical protein